MRHAIVCVLLLSLSGCGGEPTLDATSDETAQASIERIGATLDPAGKMRFMRSVMALSMAPIAQRAGQAARGETDATPLRASESLKALHGLTAAEINAKAEALSASQGSP